MAVTYRSSGTIVANGDAGIDMSGSLPSGLAIDDIMIFVGMDADNEHFDDAMPIGWAVIHSDNASGNLGFTFAWKRYDGTETDWQFDTPSGAGSLVCGVIHAYQGCITTGTPYDSLSTRGVVNGKGQVTNFFSASGVGIYKVGIIIIEDNVSLTDSSDGDWTVIDNQTTTIGSDGRLILSESLILISTRVWFITGTNEYGTGLGFYLIADSGSTLALSGTINTSSNVLGDVIIKASLDGTINTSSTVTGNVIVTKQLSGTVSTSSSVTAELTYKPLQLTGSISTSSSVTANANVKISLSGSINTSSTISADATVLRSLSGNISLSSTVSADAVIKMSLSGSVNTSSTLSADIVITSQLSGLINTNSSVSGDLTFVIGTKQLSGTINCSSTINGNAIIKAQLSGNINTSSIVSGDLTFAGTTLQLSGLISCSSSVSADASIKVSLSGNFNTSSLVIANATIKSALSGVINNLSTVTANLIYQIKQLIGTITTLSTVSGNTTLKKTISGLISTNTTLSGNIIKTSNLSGLINISSTVSGDLSLLASSEGNEISYHLSTATILEHKNSLVLLKHSKKTRATIVNIN